jgi:NAD(P)-dependent dehydrogenase (short-subunit alcohol dehydrogenase family)
MQRTVLITGASSGIGRACALLAGARGYAVAVHYRKREAKALAVVERIRAAGARAVAVQADLRDPTEITRVYAHAERELGPLSAVINNAGVALRVPSVAEVDPAALSALFAVNVLSVMLSCGEAVKRMARSRGGAGGVIVNVSSMAATIGGRPGNAHYAASKAAVDTFTLGLAKEVAAEGIRAISLRPGMVDTEGMQARLTDPALAATMRASIPLGRTATLDEVAQPILWLLSEEASFITGACIDVSGGGFHIARG